MLGENNFPGESSHENPSENNPYLGKSKEELEINKVRVLKQYSDPRINMHFFGSVAPGSHELDSGDAAEAMYQSGERERLLKQLIQMNEVLGKSPYDGLDTKEKPIEIAGEKKGGKKKGFLGRIFGKE